ncbi:hypothetical protein [Vibrio tasmaniensis]|uniref:hypothetical protein n=1 Tax=Vibrio tasmaniensis TaxID=212663 RepID=UPI00107F74D5|nr:hypothetical protein [Vibrio tasmaniensis]
MLTVFATSDRFELAKAIQHFRYDALTAQQVPSIQLDLSSDTDEHHPYAAATCNRVVALLKTMGKLTEEYLSIANVAIKVSRLPGNNTRTRYCDLNETRHIIEATLNYHCRSRVAYIALLFLTGCRATERSLKFGGYRLEITLRFDREV